MKKSIFSIVLIAFYAISVYSQAVTVANTNMNLVYIGIDNPIQITAQGYEASDLAVAVSQGSIAPSADKKGTFIWKVSATGTAKISVSAKGKLLYETDFMAKRIGMPIASLNNNTYSPNLIKVEKFQEQTGLTAIFNDKSTTSCNVTSYELTMVPSKDKGDPVTFKNRGASFNPPAINLVGHAESGFIYYFDNIQVRCEQNGEEMKVAPLVFAIK
ncbi:MAG: gliding motility protein GldM [Bacteroidota bacterium]|jgi:hypothetical protein